MKKIIFFIKLTLDAIRDTRKIIKYFSLIQINGYLVIFKIFFVRFFYCFQYVRSKQSILITNKSNNFFYLEEEYFKVDDISKNINNRNLKQSKKAVFFLKTLIKSNNAKIMTKTMFL